MMNQAGTALVLRDLDTNPVFIWGVVRVEIEGHSLPWAFGEGVREDFSN